MVSASTVAALVVQWMGEERQDLWVNEAKIQWIMVYPVRDCQRRRLILHSGKLNK